MLFHFHDTQNIPWHWKVPHNIYELPNRCNSSKHQHRTFLDVVLQYTSQSLLCAARVPVLYKQFFTAATKRFNSNFVFLFEGFASYLHIVIPFCHLLGIVWLYLLPTFTYLVPLSQLGFDSWHEQIFFFIF